MKWKLITDKESEITVFTNNKYTSEIKEKNK